MDASPHIETINIQLLEIPNLDFVVSLFSSSIFNLELLAIPGLMPFIRAMAKKYMGPILLPPFSLQLSLPQIISGSNISIGILEIRIKNVQNLKRSTNPLNAVGSPYLTFRSGSKLLATSNTSVSKYNPEWDETIYIQLKTFFNPITVTLLDKMEKLKDKSIGVLQLNLASLRKTPQQRHLKSFFLRNSRNVGDLHFDLHFHPTLNQKRLPDGTIEEIPDLTSGIGLINIESLKLINQKSKKLNLYVEVYINSKLVWTTKKISGINSFEWNSTYEAIVLDCLMTRCKFQIKNHKDEIIASTTQTLSSLLDRTMIDKNSIPLKNGKGDLKIITHWKPVDLGIKNDMVPYIPPIGIVRIFVNKAKNLKNTDKLAVCDPYVKILVDDIEKGRTPEKWDTLNPIWNTAISVAVTSPNQKITIQCNSHRTLGGDLTIGTLKLPLQGLFQKDRTDNYTEYIDDKQRTGLLYNNRGLSGELTYYVSFYPSLPILSLEEIHQLDKINERKQS